MHRLSLRSICACAALGLGFVYPGSSSAQTAEPGAAQSSTAGGNAEADEYGNGPELGIRLPPPIAKKQFDRYVVLLSLSEPQLLFFEQIYGEYSKKAELLVETEMPNLKALSRKGGNASIQMQMFEAAEFGNRLAEQEQKIMAKLRGLENDLFFKLETVLAEPQLANLNRVKLKRQRETLILWDSYMAGSKIDLGVFAEQMFDPPRLARMEPALAEYEAAVTPAMVQLDKLMVRCRTEGRYLDAEGFNASREGGPDAQARMAAVNQKYDSFMPDAGRLQRRIADLNDEHLLRIAQQLNEADRQAMIHAYRMMVYREHYPNPLWADSLYETILKDAELGDEQRQALLSLYDEYNRSRESVWKKMAELIKDQGELRVKTRQLGRTLDAELMRKLRQDRWNVDKRFVEQLKATLPAEVAVEFEPAFDEYRKKAVATIEESESDNYPLR